MQSNTLRVSDEVKQVNRLFLALVLVGVVTPFLLEGFFVPGGPLEHAGVNQMTIISELLYFLAGLIFIWAGGQKVYQDVRLGHMPPGSFLWIMALSFLLQPVMTWLNLISMSFAENYVAAGMSTASASFVVNLLYMALAPALAEEFIFRGLIYHGLRKAGIKKAVVLSALMFGLIHLNFNQFFYAFLVGMVFAVLVETTETLYSSMILHFLINARSVVLLAEQDVVSQAMARAGEAQETFTSAQMLTAALFYTPIALLSLAGCIWVLRRMAEAAREREIRRAAGETEEGRRPGPSWGTYEKPARPEPGRGEGTAALQTAEGAVTPALVAGIILSVAYMIWFDFL